MRKVSHLISLILNFQLDFLTFSLLFRTATLLMAPVVSVGTSSEDVAARVGHHVIKHQDIAIAESGVFRIAVSGGSMGKVLKKALVDDKQIAPLVKWDKWEVYFSDERLVPLDHPESNYGLLKQNVLDHVPKVVVHPIDVSLLTGKEGELAGADEAKDQEIADKYAELLPKDGKLDLLLLGCGPDGHTCSLFPGHPLLEEKSKLVALIRDSPKPPPRRISVTFPLLAKATSLAFIAEGEGKAPTLKKIFEEGDTSLPSKLVSDLVGPEVVWFVNEPAVKGVKL